MSCDVFLSPAPAEGEGQTAYNDRDQGKPFCDGASERRLQNVDGVFPRGAALRVRGARQREAHSQHGGVFCISQEPISPAVLDLSNDLFTQTKLPATTKEHLHSPPT